MDILLDENHDAVFNNGPPIMTKGSSEEIAQRLRIKLLSFKGEWFHNTAYGVPYRQEILGHKVVKSKIDRILQEAILAETGVREITYFNSSIVHRTYSLKFSVRDSSGNNIEVSLNDIGV